MARSGGLRQADDAHASADVLERRFKVDMMPVHVPVTVSDVLDEGPFFHGTKVDLRVACRHAECRARREASLSGCSTPIAFSSSTR